MKRIAAGLIGLALWVGPWAARAEHDCGLGESAVGALFPMPLAAKAIAADHHLNILVMGAGSSMLPGPEGASHAFPARLQAALTKKWPGVAISVSADAVSRRSASEMLHELKPALVKSKANLLVWQTGTYEAVRGIDPDSFAAVLDRGIDQARSAGADVVFVNMQYSPHTDTLMAVNHYAEAMRWVALQRGVSLFDRFAVMKTWSELGLFDLRNATNKLDTAQRVHDCIGYLLSDLVNEAVRQGGETVTSK